MTKTGYTGRILTAIGVLAVIAFGTPQGGGAAPVGDAARANTAASQPSAAAGVESRLVTARRAIITAQRAVSRTHAYEVETDRLAGRRTWEVKLRRGSSSRYEVHVSADGRRVLRVRSRRGSNRDVRRASQATVALTRALTIAGRRVGRSGFDEADIDMLGRRVVWDVTFKRPANRDVEVSVDARSGRVLRVERDS